MAQDYLILTAIACGGMFALWLIQLRTRDAGIVDAGWAYGLCLAAVLFAVRCPGPVARRAAVAAIAGFWAARLGTYLLVDRVLKGRGEDGRYRRMRLAMGAAAPAGFLAFFELQAGFILLFSLPLYAAAANTARPLGLADAAGILVGCGAIVGEYLADRTLRRFRSRPENRSHTCRDGLWRYSRHPNYFFECVHWVAYLLLAWGGSLWWLAAAGPLIMLVFILVVTGVPHTEKQALSHRPDYAEYKRTTNMFIPWFPKPGAETPSSAPQERKGGTDAHQRD